MTLFDVRAHGGKRFMLNVVGLGSFLAWLYCSFFSCALVVDSPGVRSSEAFWMVAELTSAIVSALVLLAVSRDTGGRFARALTENCLVTFAAAALCAVGIACIWLSTNGVDIPALRVVGAVLAGMGIGYFVIFWGVRVSTLATWETESTVLGGFAVSVGAYLVLLPLKSTAATVVIAFLPLVSALCARYAARESSSEQIASTVSPTAASPEQDPDGKLPVRVASWFVLYTVLWASYSYFRTISAPVEISSRFMHYVIPFSIAGVATLVALKLVLQGARFINPQLIVRVTIPTTCLSYLVLSLDTANVHVRDMAYTVNFFAMFLTQVGAWIVGSKIMRATQTGAVRVFAVKVFAVIACANGLGIAAGYVPGELVCDLFGLHLPAMALLVPIFVLVAVSMVVVGVSLGERTRNLTHVTPHGLEMGAVANGAALDATAQADLALAIRTQADRIEVQYDLSAREHEVLLYLLAGRNRPYIRDALGISINTVNAHVRSIYTKCAVHSQQELLDLAHQSTPASV